MNKIITLILLIIFITGSDIISQTPYNYIDPIKIDTPRSPFRKAGIPLITDLEKDGMKEIIVFTVDYNAAAIPLCNLHVLNYDGSNYPNFPIGMQDYALDIASGDINGNGYLDIAIRFTHRIDVIDRFGNSLPGFPLNYSDGDENPVKFISLYDLDNDNKLEIIVSKNREICVFNFDGSIRSGWPRSISGTSKYNPAIGDIDGDGFGEIILNSFGNYNSTVDSAAITIFRHNGILFNENWPIMLDSNYHSWSSSPSLYINKNNPDLTFILIAAGRLIDGSSFGNHLLMKLNINGKVLDKKYYSDYMNFGTLVMGDLDRDNILEFVSGTQYGITLSAFKNSLTKIEGWPRFGVGEQEATAVIGKLTFANELNIINNRWSADQGFGFIQSYTKDGIDLPWSPLRPIGLVKAVSLADLNNDGNVEMISTSTKTLNETYLHIWTIPGIPYTHEDFPWPQYGHDRYRTNQFGFIPPDEPVGIQPYSTTVPEKFSLSQNYPNPFNPSTVINYELRVTGFTKLIVYDVLGHELATLVNEKQIAGSYRISFDGSNLSSGVYFYKLDAGEFSETKRMILLK